MTPCLHHKNDEGFSVLEALIAMAILATAMLPLLALQGQFVRAVDRFDRISARIEAKDASLNYLKTINFTRFSTGEENLGEFVLKWDSKVIQAPKMTRGQNGVTGRYEVTLYSVDVTLSSKNGEENSFIINGLGWRPVRPFVE